ncbi:uxin efflux carrier superfamily [Diaporthe amygdali]|uniref:uxin efflux carrier superfamily n=1 Tax=Phomopsis amygdali TaxID=1214568 RepID=UPI0022FF353C|nr:uxin efflux carrier superfamily [Diaporthe amygdali]KAJ0123040.1 uxin efflux carrier superfamily [Diaporthe amygdali]
MPASFRLTNPGAPPLAMAQTSPFVVFTKPHDSHPSLDHLVLLVFEAVMEVVCVSLPGYIIARLGHFDADKQKFLANLNVMLFTPCLIFTKLASQLNADKLIELAVIPIIFVIQTAVSYLVAQGVSRLFGFHKRASNFVTAMGVFGNSNSLPISLVISLSQTLKGLHWDRIPGDNDDEVAARGILYLMIFQQLGQLVRWSWGYHVLLAPKEKYADYDNERIEEGRYAGDAMGSEETDNLLQPEDDDTDDHRSSASDTYEPAGRTPVANQSRASLADLVNEDGTTTPRKNPYGRHHYKTNSARPSTADTVGEDNESLHDHSILSFPRIRNNEEAEIPEGVKGYPKRCNRWVKQTKARTTAAINRKRHEVYSRLPPPLQRTVDFQQVAAAKLSNFLWEFMNPPLWAMLAAVIVASIPDLQRLFFQEGSFIKNSVTSAVSSSAGVAVPLILVVLGANLARNTQKRDGEPEEAVIGSKLLVASLICRMLLPTLIMAPILAVFAKYVPVSILDDPIFVIVCFLLTGAPSALQLAQICQINSVYENVMSKILFQSYVIWILPSTLILVMLALEVVEWAQ